MDIHADKNTDTSSKMQVKIYRCCPNCGKGDTPLSGRKHCEVCGHELPKLRALAGEANDGKTADR
jgi:uncharacterized protein (DUF983 family)